MSLSPKDFSSAITQVRNNNGSVLVYRHKIVGGQPSGCDGWPLKLSGDKGFLLTDWRRDGEEESIFPPNWHNLSEEEHMSASEDLAAKVMAVLEQTKKEDKKENSY